MVSEYYYCVAPTCAGKFSFTAKEVYELYRDGYKNDGKGNMVSTWGEMFADNPGYSEYVKLVAAGGDTYNAYRVYPEEIVIIGTFVRAEVVR